MKIVYRVTEEDFLEAHDLFVAHEKWYRRMSRRVMPWMGGVMLSLSALILVRDRDPIVAVPFGLMGAYFLYCGFALRRYFRKLYRTDQRFKHDFTLNISEDIVHFVTPFQESQTKWTALVRYLESENIFMLFSAPMIFSIIPKRAFAPGEVDIFRDLLRRNVQAVPETGPKS